MRPDTPIVVAAVLSPREAAEFKRLEGVMSTAQQSFADAGAALKVIRDKKLYRATHKTWEKYCLDRWDFSDEQARRLIQAAEIVDILKTPPIGGVLPANEAQARQLTNLMCEPDNLREAWASVLKKAGKGRVTAAIIGKVVEEVTGWPAEAEPGDISEAFAEVMAALPPERVHEVLTQKEEEVAAADEEEATPRRAPKENLWKEWLASMERLTDRCRQLVAGGDVDGRVAKALPHLEAFWKALGKE